MTVEKRFELRAPSRSTVVPILYYKYIYWAECNNLPCCMHTYTIPVGIRTAVSLRFARNAPLPCLEGHRILFLLYSYHHQCRVLSDWSSNVDLENDLESISIAIIRNILTPKCPWFLAPRLVTPSAPLMALDSGELWVHCRMCLLYKGKQRRL